MVNNPGGSLWDRFLALEAAFDEFVDLIGIVEESANEMTSFEFVEEWNPRRILELCQLVRHLEDDARIFRQEIAEFRNYLSNRSNFDAVETEFAHYELRNAISRLNEYCGQLRTICQQERTTIVQRQLAQFFILIEGLESLENTIREMCRLALAPQAEEFQQLSLRIEVDRRNFQERAELFRVVIPQVPMTSEDTIQLYERLRQSIVELRVYINEIISFLD